MAKRTKRQKTQGKQCSEWIVKAYGKDQRDAKTIQELKGKLRASINYKPL